MDVGSGGSRVRGCSSHSWGLTMGAEPNSTARALQSAARVGRRCFPEETAGTIPRQIVGFYFPVALFLGMAPCGIGCCAPKVRWPWKPKQKQQLALEGKTL